MSSVDLARVGACVLKHAVTGEVSPDGCSAVGAPRTPPRTCPRAPAAASGPGLGESWEGRGERGLCGLSSAGSPGFPEVYLDESKRGGIRGRGRGPTAPLTGPTQAVELRSLWQEQACVVAGLRRFGCAVCRWIAQDLSNLKGVLDLHGVCLVGVGPEALGLQEFLDGGYFAGGAAPPLLSPIVRTFATRFSLQEPPRSRSCSSPPTPMSPAPSRCGSICTLLP